MESLNWEPLITAIVLIASVIYAFFRVNHITAKLDAIGKDLSNVTVELRGIKEKIGSIWDLTLKRANVGTVYLSMPNLGKVGVSAQPEEDQMKYIVRTGRQINTGLVVRRSKETGFDGRERELLAGPTTSIQQLDQTSFVLGIPTLIPELTVQVIGEFIEWLDGDYPNQQGLILESYETPILPDRQDL